MNFINKLMQAELMPDNLSLGRLLCLNKNANEPGNIDSIRPIVILGVIIKICEYPHLQALRKMKLNNNQIGFLRGMGCEVNIMRLRQLVHDLKWENYERKKKMEKRYLLFIDLKCAFDSVPLIKLIKKLHKKKVPMDIINGLIKLMNCSKISPDLKETISINGGVAQGKLCSPMLFNIYFDDLLDELNEILHATLAYADDLVIICKNDEELTRGIETLRKWSKANDIMVNEKKSGILILNSDNIDADYIHGFPVVDHYRYLGVIINSKMSAKGHIMAQNRKVNAYFDKNFMLLKKYFTPFSLVRIVNIFVKSRLSYGLCCFLDSPACMKALDNSLLRHLKSIFGLPKLTSHKLIRVVLGEPELRTRLSLRLLKNWHKHKKHYGTYPDMYAKTLLNYFSIFDLYPTNEGLENIRKKYWDMKAAMFSTSVGKVAKDYLNISIRHEHSEYLKKYIFNFPDLRNFLVIRYFTNTTRGTSKRLFPRCGHEGCFKANYPSHAANDCVFFKKFRENKIKEIEKIFKRNGLKLEKNLFEYLQAIFFTIDMSKNIAGEGKDLKKVNVTRNKDRNELINIMKDTIRYLIVQDKSKSNLDLIEEENDEEKSDAEDNELYN